MNCHINLEENFENLDEPPNIENSSDLFQESQEFVDEFKKLIDNLNKRKIAFLDKSYLPKINPEPDDKDNNPNCSCLDTS